MPDIFDYDVFLSFSSKDEETVKPMWQELSLNGLRVFWSDETLKQNAGQSFFAKIQESLIRSRHFVLLMSTNAEESEWVKVEYETFFNDCHVQTKGERRLIVYPIGGYDIARLPPFLRRLQVARSIKAIIPLLGGVDIQALRRENAELREKVETANDEIRKLRDEIEYVRTTELADSLANDTARDEEVQRLKDEAAGLRQLNADIDKKLRAANQQIRDLQSAAAAPPPPVLRLERTIGRVSNYFVNGGVAAVRLNGELQAGDRVRIKGTKTDFEQVVRLMKVDNRETRSARTGEVTFKTDSWCREGDVVYKVE